MPVAVPGGVMVDVVPGGPVRGAVPDGASPDAVIAYALIPDARGSGRP